MTIGIYGGSYDPIHIGHTMLASFIAQTGLVDEVWLLVSRLNPLKQEGQPPAPDADRLAMARIAAAGSRLFKVDDTELHLPSPSYTYDTLCELRRQYPQHSFRLIAGADNMAIFRSWRDYDKILSEFGVIVYPRPPYTVNAGTLPEGAVMLDDVPQIELSSSFIRRQVSEGKDVTYYVPPAVAQYIVRHNLYR